MDFVIEIPRDTSCVVLRLPREAAADAGAAEYDSWGRSPGADEYDSWQRVFAAPAR